MSSRWTHKVEYVSSFCWNNKTKLHNFYGQSNSKSYDQHTLFGTKFRGSEFSIYGGRFFFLREIVLWDWLFGPSLIQVFRQPSTWWLGKVEIIENVSSKKTVCSLNSTDRTFCWDFKQIFWEETPDVNTKKTHFVFLC